jgi:hypothetical protein
MVTDICNKCGDKVEFKAKPRKPYNPYKIEAVAEYEIRKGKRFLKIDGEFVEVELRKINNEGHLRVMPILWT